MPTLYTVGYEKRPLAEFIGLLRTAGVDAVIDARLRNTSHLAGYTKRDDLAFLLQEGFGIAYEHRAELAPSDEILDAIKQDRDWQRYEDAFRALLAERHSEAIGTVLLARYKAPCLLCHEATPKQCHRRLVAEWWAEHIPGCTVAHL